MSERLIDAVCPHCGRKGKTVRLVSHDDGHTKLSRLCTNCGGEWMHTFDRDWRAEAQHKRLEAEVDRLRAALRWYANPRNHFPIERRSPGDPDPAVVFVEEPPILRDGGTLARKALEAKP